MSEDRFLSRWSRRKAKARSGRAVAEPERPAPVLPPTVTEASRPSAAPAVAPAPDDPLPETAPETTPESSSEPTEEELEAEAAELGLPPLESLGEGSDFKAFMAKEVPARLRNRALRKLWISNPVLANLDGLVDYGEDFTDAATVVENMTTAYRVGRGYMRPGEEPEEEPEEMAEEMAEETGAEPSPDDPDRPDPDAERGAATASEESDISEAEKDADSSEPAADDDQVARG
jgi:hypothetical protein